MGFFLVGSEVMLQQLLQEGDEEFRISGVVHVLDNISPLVLAYIARALLSQHGFDVAVGFEGELPPQEHLQQFRNGLLHLLLHQAELFVTLVFEDLAEDHDVVILTAIALDCTDNASRPLKHETLSSTYLQSVLLVEEGVHVLLHRFPGQLSFLALTLDA